MLKLISCVLSFAIIFTSVTPSLAQVGAMGRARNYARYGSKGTTEGAAKKAGSSVDATLRKFGTTQPLNGINPHLNDAVLRAYTSSLISASGTHITHTPVQAVSSLKRISDVQFKQVPSLDSKEAAAILPETVTNISSLGLFGSAQQEASIILETFTKSVNTPVEPVVTAVSARALLRLGAYEQLEQMSAISTQHPILWDGISSYAQAHNLPVTIVQKERAAVDVQALEKTLPNLGPLALNPSAEVTRAYVNMDASKILAQQQEARAARQAGHTSSSQTATQPESKLQSPVVTAESSSATVSSAPVDKPVSLETSSEETIPADAITQTSSTSGVLYSGLFPIPSFGVRGAKSSAQKVVQAANKQARYTLALVQPSPTSLRAILDSAAAESYKKEALLGLYKQGKLSSAINALPKSVQDKLNAVKDNEQELKNVLFSLYYSDSFRVALENLSDHAIQVNWEKDLDAILQDPAWASKALTAYNNAQVLPSYNPENFEGVVPSVPEVEQKKILSTFREAGFASENMGTAIDKKDVLYYQNRIPFYYRYANGTLSAHPVGILSQESANWYGRILSNLHLASRPGFEIPKGFVLVLDESGQWKFLPAAGELSTIEKTPASLKILQQIQREGSYRVALDTPYTSSDLLSMANMLENKRDLNLELVLNTPHSLKQYLKLHAFFIGNDAGMSLAGPFTKMLKAWEGLGATMANAVSGVGYLTPWIAGWAMPLMTKLGNVKTIQYVYGAAAAALAVSAGMGMFWSEPIIGGENGIPLGILAVPTVAMVLGASLLNSFNNTLLNFFKDPATRTAAHLSFAENKQWSRLALTGATALAAAAGGSWAIVVPVGLGLLGMSELLFLNTPIYKNRAQQEKKESLDPQKYAQFSKAYKQQIRKLSEVKDINFRVKMVYASYAASLMALSQGSTEILGTTWGPIMAAVFMLGTAFTRKGASKAIEKNKLTDDQMTGVSLPLLTTTGAALALLPYSGALAIVTGLVGILHYVATATPGQMDAARLQNIVSAEMQKQKANVLADNTLSAEEKKATLAELSSQEKVWASLASKDYSFANGHGLAGIAVAAAAAYLFRDLGPQWTKDVLSFISDHTVGTNSDALGLARLIFGYSAGMAGVLAWKNRALFKDFMQVFHKQKITRENIDDGKINPATFGMNSNNVELRLVNVEKTMKKLQENMIEYSISSEQKLTQHYQGLVESYNRLVAASNLPGNEAILAPYFDQLVDLTKVYEGILDRNDHSIMLQRAFEEFKNSLLSAEGTLNSDLQYIEEGMYDMPAHFEQYQEARSLIHEIQQLVLHDIYGGQVTADTYANIITYYNRVQKALTQYKEANMADSPRVLELNESLNDILRGLKKRQKQLGILDDNAGPTDTKHLQALKDLLAGIK